MELAPVGNLKRDGAARTVLSCLGSELLLYMLELKTESRASNNSSEGVRESGASGEEECS